jgi:hypothetical protein
MLVDERRAHRREDLELQPRGAADDLADLVEVRAVLPGHLDHDGLSAGGDRGLAHRELVDAVGDRLDRLPHGVLFELRDLVLLERQGDLVAAARHPAQREAREHLIAELRGVGRRG